MIPEAKRTVNLDSEIIQSLLQGDLICLQSVVKDIIEHALETKAEEILGAGMYDGPRKTGNAIGTDTAVSG